MAVEARQVGAADRTPWQRALPPDVDDHLIGDLAVWRAAHGIPPTEPSPTGPVTNEPDAARNQARLNRRLSAPTPIFHTQTAETLSGRSYEPASDKLSSIGSTNFPHAT